MSRLTIHTAPPQPGYQRGALRSRRLSFTLDGWPLLADNYREALDEAKAMDGREPKSITPEH